MPLTYGKCSNKHFFDPCLGLKVRTSWLKLHHFSCSFGLIDLFGCPALNDAQRIHPLTTTKMSTRQIMQIIVSSSFLLFSDGQKQKIMTNQWWEYTVTCNLSTLPKVWKSFTVNLGNLNPLNSSCDVPAFKLGLTVPVFLFFSPHLSVSVSISCSYSLSWALVPPLTDHTE